MAVSWITKEDLGEPDHPDAQFAIEFSSFILYKLSGEKYPGVREASEWYGYRPEEQACANFLEKLTVRSVVPEFITEAAPLSKKLNLRRRPVISITSIEDYNTGVELPSDSYDLRNYAYLHKKDGYWNLDCGGYVVNYQYGMNPPYVGKRAAYILAKEILLSISDPEKCSLPARVTSVSRQGVNYTVLDPSEFLSEGRTGLYEVDLFLGAVNPVRAYKRPRVIIPGKPRGETII